MLITLCHFFHKLPSEILEEDAEVIQLMQLYQMANPGKGGSDG